MPQNGWVEHDPFDILSSVTNCINTVMQKFDAAQLAAIGITNQRETTVVWDKLTGKPLYNAIVWLDTRTHSICERLIRELGSRDHFRPISGLPISTYFSALKLCWLLENVPAVKQAVAENRAFFGTIDTWLLWNLSGGVHGGVHCTDVTNASRTLLFNLHSKTWDEDSCRLLGIPMQMLPQIRSSSEIYAHVANGPLRGVPIASLIGDQQGALVGQLCFKAGEAKNTYGTGCFLLLNTGSRVVHSRRGLLTTVAFQMGPKAPIQYALEGGVAIAGAAITWLRDNLQLIQSPKEMEPLGRKVPDNGGVYFVPAFSGLFAPYWREDARGVIVGLSQYSTKSHLIRAVLEASCFQTNDVIQAMMEDVNVQMECLKVDGGMTIDPLFLQTQADILNLPVARPTNAECTALGAAIAAGLAVGFWRDLDDVRTRLASQSTVFLPTMKATQRTLMLRDWRKAVDRSFNWVEREDNVEHIKGNPGRDTNLIETGSSAIVSKL